ncbi:hypothetical protein MMC25_003085 [Agyrium rufum]|nr:hypothetical protein [Agyrium rufum]
MAGYFAPSKRIIVNCDGTWLDSDNGSSSSKLEVPSNVTRISRAIKPLSRDKIPQVVFYQNGIGSVGTKSMRTVAGATGEGLSNNIREAYNFIGENYTSGDELFFIGFSRGAFTARSVAGFIGSVGILTKQGRPYLPVIFEDFEHRNDPDYVSKFPDLPFPNKPSVASKDYAFMLEEAGFTKLNVPIKAVGVWETVGSLGIPRISWLEQLGLQRPRTKEYNFYDTSLSNNIENAFQALALDEERASFSPAVWEKPVGNRTNLRQVWFPGVHSNVGGGYDDQELADITLAWMIAQLSPLIDFDQEYLVQQYEQNRQYYVDTGQRLRPWSFGKIYQSLTGLYLVGGTRIRSPGLYTRVDPETGETTSRALRRTCEYIHPCVRTRINCGGPGVRDRGLYDPKALQNFKLRIRDGGAEGERQIVTWESRTKRKAGSRKGEPKIILQESPLWETELLLLERSQKVRDYLLQGVVQNGARQRLSPIRETPALRNGSGNLNGANRSDRGVESSSRALERY